jgi:hypothetical protein
LHYFFLYSKNRAVVLSLGYQATVFSKQRFLSTAFVQTMVCKPKQHYEAIKDSVPVPDIRVTTNT